MTPMSLRILQEIDEALGYHMHARSEAGYPSPIVATSYDGDHKTGELIITTPEGDFVLRSVDITPDSDHWDDE